jgi:hypothetical protein
MDDLSKRRGHDCKDGMIGRGMDRLFYRAGRCAG